MNYIVFEGIDGSGKSTVSKMFLQYLLNKGYSVLYTKEPYTSDIDVLIRKNQTNKTLLFLFLADRSIHIEKLKKQHVDFIVSDRSFYSTICYQGYGGGIDVEFVTKLNEFVVEDFLPNTVFYLDCTPEVALSRIKKLDAIEHKHLTFFQKVREGYLDLAKKHNFITINAQGNLQEVFSNTVEYYETRFS
ncbi:Thymidylate kinase [Desulfurella amilsii]|uniref:Thymidylate kinase n=1 Tax=Desulfurella amilsii TaxID=1562698 RepID=A0A1X4XUL8_9BACT|nr:dTMP kinase [Desulfurella amilsii]OSS41221.1 Thymidylate kinase [Desulfurella amilsii]